MKTSPIQLLESTFDKVVIEPNSEYEGPDADGVFEVVGLQFHQFIRPASEFWDDQAEPPNGAKQRTYSVQLGVRADPEVHTAYFFEIVCSGIVMSNVDRIGTEYPADEACADYGYTFLYGIIREQVSTFTSRMVHGRRMLPTMSFMGDGRRFKERSLSAADSPVPESSEVEITANSGKRAGE